MSSQIKRKKWFSLRENQSMKKKNKKVSLSVRKKNHFKFSQREFQRVLFFEEKNEFEKKKREKEF